MPKHGNKEALQVSFTQKLTWILPESVTFWNLLEEMKYVAHTFVLIYNGLRIMSVTILQLLSTVQVYQMISILIWHRSATITGISITKPDLSLRFRGIADIRLCSELFPVISLMFPHYLGRSRFCQSMGYRQISPSWMQVTFQKRMSIFFAKRESTL